MGLESMGPEAETSEIGHFGTEFLLSTPTEKQIFPPGSTGNRFLGNNFLHNSKGHQEKGGEELIILI